MGRLTVTEVRELLEWTAVEAVRGERPGSRACGTTRRQAGQEAATPDGTDRPEEGPRNAGLLRSRPPPVRRGDRAGLRGGHRALEGRRPGRGARRLAVRAPGVSRQPLDPRGPGADRAPGVQGSQPRPGALRLRRRARPQVLAARLLRADSPGSSRQPPLLRRGRRLDRVPTRAGSGSRGRPPGIARRASRGRRARAPQTPSNARPTAGGWAGSPRRRLVRPGRRPVRTDHRAPRQDSPQNSNWSTGMPLGTDGGTRLRRLAGVARGSSNASRRKATRASNSERERWIGSCKKRVKSAEDRPGRAPASRSGQARSRHPRGRNGGATSWRSDGASPHPRAW